jgi:hypothetical protein
MRLGLIIRITVFLLVSLTVGIGSARWLIARSAHAVPVSAGAWKIWLVGSGTDDPYGTVHYLITGRLPPANRVRIYETERDDDGALFDSDCVYKVSGSERGARWWELAIIDPLTGPIFDGNAPINGISSAQIIGDPNATFTVTISREPKPGNWISPGELTRYALTVSLRSARPHQTIEPAEALPRIAKGECL